MNAIANVIVACIFLSPFALVLWLVLASRRRKARQAAQRATARRNADISYWLNCWRTGRDVLLAGEVLDAMGFPPAVLTVVAPIDPHARLAAVRSEMWAWEDPTHPVAAHRLAQLDPQGHLQRQVKISDGAARMGFAVQW